MCEVKKRTVLGPHHNRGANAYNNHFPIFTAPVSTKWDKGLILIDDTITRKSTQSFVRTALMRLIKHISYVGLNRSPLGVTNVVLHEATVLVSAQE
jgi:hypothetical protein